MKKPILKVRGISNDTSRCYGTGCNKKQDCLRYKQIAEDVKTSDTGTWVSYTATLMDKDSGHCSMMIGID